MTVKEASKILGEALAKESAVITFNAAKQAYDTDSELSSMLAEYRTARTLLGELYAKADATEEESRSADAVNTRVAERTDAIRTNPVYLALATVNADLSYYAFGEIPGCTHDCSSCSGCH